MSFLLAEFYLETCAIGKRNDGLAGISLNWRENVLVEGEAFLSELDEFFSDLLEVGAEPDDFLETGQTRDVEQVGLIIDKKVSELV